MEAFRHVWRRDHDSGFTIVESVVALVIVFGTLLVLFRALDGSIRVVNESRRQTVALALAGELLERARALEWENVGLTADSNDADCHTPVPADGIAGVACGDWATEFGVTPDGLGGYLFEGETIVFANGDTFDPFLSFTETLNRDGVDYQRFMFVSKQTDAAGDEMYRKITAIVQWTPPSGFRREVRQVTFASAFETPPSPILDANVEFNGGRVNLIGTVAGTESRANLITGSFFEAPAASIRARSDYVSSALVEGRSPASEWVFESALAPFEVRDKFNHDALLHVSDDDFSTTAPVAPANITNYGLAAWRPLDFINSLAGDEVTGALAPSNSTVLLATAKAKDTSDELPYAEVSMESADEFFIGTWEYLFVADVLGEAVGAWPFFPVMYGQSSSGPALTFDGTIDRYSATASSRKISSSFSLDPQEIHFFYDWVYKSNHPQFRGWLRVTLPSVTGTAEAGEAALPPTLSAGNVEIDYWDTSSDKYEPLSDLTGDPTPTVAEGTASIVDLDALSSSYTFDTTVLPALGDALTSDADGLPNLEYIVTIDSLSLNSLLETTETYPAGAIAGAQSGLSTIGTGTLHYFVRDTKAGIVLFDYDLTFELPGVSATTAYIDPEQAP
jgi:type II secretory pathway pseudopilin PulG